MSDIEMAKEALRRAREHERADPGMAAAIMKSALRTLAGDRNFVVERQAYRFDPTLDPPVLLPDCMMPDGAEPCQGYLVEFGQRMDGDRRLRRIVAIIETVENRCMAVDGPVTPTLREMTEAEMREIYRLAKGEPQCASTAG